MSALLAAKQPAPAAAPGPLPTIQTVRLTLRVHRLSDADAITDTLSDFAVTRMLSRVPVPYDRQDALDWLVPVTSGVLSDWHFAVTDGDDTHIGSVGLDLRAGRWHLGYWLNRFFWGRGYMSEAVPAVLDRFFRRMPQVNVHAGVFVDNPASLRLLEKFGFRMTGCAETFCFARNTMVPMVETVLRPGELRMPAVP